MTIFKNGFIVGILGIFLFSINLSAEKTKKATGEVLVQIDHLIVAISDLDKGVNKFYKLTGVKPVFGGEHPGYGTHNSLVTLGSKLYLEIIAPKPGATVEIFKNLPTLTPFGWAVSTNSIAKLKEKMNGLGYETTDPVKGSRIQKDGSKLEWETMFIKKPFIKEAPFFICWSQQTVHPAETSTKGCQLKSLTVFSTEPVPLQRLVSDLSLEIKVNKGPKYQMKIVLDCPNGEIIFPLIK
jgi:hypothetical protein